MMILDVQRTEMVRASATQDLAQKNFEVWAGARGEIRMRCPPLVKSRQSRFNLKYHEPFHHPAVHLRRTDLVAWK